MKILAAKIKDYIDSPSTTGKPGRYCFGLYGEEESQGPERVDVDKLGRNVSYEKIRVTTHYFVLKGELVMENCHYGEGAYLRIDA